MLLQTSDRFNYLHSIELFQSTCDELQDWIREKDNGMNNDEIGKDLKHNELLKRKHAVSLCWMSDVVASIDFMTVQIGICPSAINM